MDYRLLVVVTDSTAKCWISTMVEVPGNPGAKSHPTPYEVAPATNARRATRLCAAQLSVLVLAAAAPASVSVAATSSPSPLTSLPDCTPVAGAQPAVGAGTLAYVSARRSAIVVARVDGRRRKTIYPSDASWPAVSVDGKLVAFMRGHNEVWVMRRDGSNAHFVAHGTSPSFSPDGRRLAIGGAQTARFRYELDVVDLDGSDRHAVATDAAPYPDPSWSADGRQIAFVGYTRMQMDFTSILRVNSDGTGETGIRIYGVDPAWSPNDSWIAYTSNGDRSKPTELHLVRPDGTRDHRIARFAKRGATSGAWVGSKRVVFTTLAPDEAGIGPADDGRLWQVDTTGRGLRPLGCRVRPRS